MKELIKNKDASRWVTNQNEFCNKCGNRGFIEVAAEIDKEKFEQIFDKLDDMGIFNHDECYQKALEECRSEKFYCPNCEKGLGYADKYPKYARLL